MIERKTDYYDSFQCTADQCNLTCCQEWKIAVDDKTQTKWESKKPPVELMREEGKELITYDTLGEYTTYKDDARVIQLDTAKKCPFLNCKKLCNLVIAYGDDILSETCATFPRQVNTFEERAVKEYSLVACCPAVVDILYGIDQFHVKESKDNKEENCLSNTGYDLYENTLSEIRDQMIALVGDRTSSISEAMMTGFFILLSLLEQQDKEVEKKSSAETIGTVLHKALEEYNTREEVTKIRNTIRGMKFSKLDTFDERNELFLDLAENYRKQDIYTSWLGPIAELAEGLSEQYDEADLLEKKERFEKSFSKYEQLMRNYVASEFFANLFLPEYDLENIVVAYQWITMEYVTMKQAAFLQWMVNDREDVSYEELRDMKVIIARMMGYDEPDIREYMENSFEDIVWDWGYLALLCGND